MFWFGEADCVWLRRFAPVEYFIQLPLLVAPGCRPEPPLAYRAAQAGNVTEWPLSTSANAYSCPVAVLRGTPADDRSGSVTASLRSVRRQRAGVTCDRNQRYRRPYRRVARLRSPERRRYRVSDVGSTPVRPRSRRVRRKLVGLRLNRCCFVGQSIKYSEDSSQIFAIRSYVV